MERGRNLDGEGAEDSERDAPELDQRLQRVIHLHPRNRSVSVNSDSNLFIVIGRGTGLRELFQIH